MQTRGIGILKKVGGAVALALLIAVAGCSKQADESVASSADKIQLKGAASAGLPSQAPLHNIARQPGAERMVVRQATLAVDVDNLDKSEKQVKESLALNGGYIDHEEGQNLASETPVMNLTIRVPEKTFETMLSGFESLGHRTQKSIMASDLTEQILDVQAQLEQTQAEANAKRLSVGSALPNELKQLQAMKAELDAKVSMSTIDLTLQQKPGGATSTAASASWGSDTWNAALSSATGVFRVIGAIALWLLAFSPIWGLMLGGGLIGYRIWKRGNRTPVSG